MTFDVISDSLGYKRLHPRPSAVDLLSYYADKYFQDLKGSYSNSYSELDKRGMSMEFALRSYQVSQARQAAPVQSFLDIGCGEGWELDSWASQGARVLGLDASEYGIRKQNPSYLDRLIVAPVEDSLEKLRHQGELFDLIYLGNTLEHFSDPSEIVRQLLPLLNKEGVVQIRVPNDYSVLQRNLVETDRTPENFWVVVPDHVSYFDHKTLSSYCESHGLYQVGSFASFPFDWFAANSNSNYVKSSEKGKEAYEASVFIQDLIFESNSIENCYGFYSSLARIGHGRDITSIFNRSPRK
jgi:2-polyprenyl-3-methyl-5-hydroxy-6-metoxy-1,4-benzoquinol methylase